MKLQACTEQLRALTSARQINESRSGPVVREGLASVTVHACRWSQYEYIVFTCALGAGSSNSLWLPQMCSKINEGCSASVMSGQIMKGSAPLSYPSVGSLLAKVTLRLS